MNFSSWNSLNQWQYAMFADEDIHNATAAAAALDPVRTCGWILLSSYKRAYWEFYRLLVHMCSRALPLANLKHSENRCIDLKNVCGVNNARKASTSGHYEAQKLWSCTDKYYLDSNSFISLTFHVYAKPYSHDQAFDETFLGQYPGELCCQRDFQFYDVDQKARGLSTFSF